MFIFTFPVHLRHSTLLQSRLCGRSLESKLYTACRIAKYTAHSVAKPKLRSRRSLKYKTRVRSGTNARASEI